MIYRELGKTGMNLSRLGFGAMRFPMKDKHVDIEQSIPLLHRAFELGINFVDTGVMYCAGEGESQPAIGEALRNWKGKKKIYISTKNHHYDIKDERTWWRYLEESLKKLGVDCIDLYNHHGLNWKVYEEKVKLPNGFYRFMLKAKEQGMIKHIAFSFHGPADDLRKLSDTGEFESVILQYNFIDRHLEDVLPHVKQKGLGVIIMGPVGGGRLVAPSEVFREKTKINTPEIALRFVFSNPNVDVALSGMNAISQLEENVKIASMDSGLNDEENKKLMELIDKCSELAKLYCTGCGYCMPCPNEVKIPEIFECYNWTRVYGLYEIASRRYEAIEKKGKGADKCEECGTCLEKCPQKIDIISQLKEAHKTLTERLDKK